MAELKIDANTSAVRSTVEMAATRLYKLRNTSGSVVLRLCTAGWVFLQMTTAILHVHQGIIYGRSHVGACIHALGLSLHGISSWLRWVLAVGAMEDGGKKVSAATKNRTTYALHTYLVRLCTRQNKIRNALHPQYPVAPILYTWYLQVLFRLGQPVGQPVEPLR